MKRFKLVPILLYSVGMLSLLFGCANPFGEPYSTTDISEYGIYKGHLSMEQEDIQSGLFIFPASDTIGMTKETYSYRCEPSFLTNDYEILLVAAYTESAYATEVARLSNLTANWDGKTQHILAAESGFSYPAYVAAFTEDGSEYALLDENTHRVIYVYRHFLTPSEHFPKEYLPQDYQVPTEYIDKELGGYSMYYFAEHYLGTKSWNVVKEH